MVLRREPTESLVINKLNRLETAHRNFRAADKQIEIKPSETISVCSLGNFAENKVCWEQQSLEQSCDVVARHVLRQHEVTAWQFQTIGTSEKFHKICLIVRRCSYKMFL